MYICLFLFFFQFPQQRVWGHGVYALTRPHLLCPKTFMNASGMDVLLLLAAFVKKRKETPDLTLPRSSKVHPWKQLSVQLRSTRENTKHIFSSSFFFYQMVAEMYFEDIRRKRKLLFNSFYNYYLFLKQPNIIFRNEALFLNTLYTIFF